MNSIFFKNRFILGTANFTQNYGADKTKIKLAQIKKILNFAIKNKINKIDTAESYLKNHAMFKYTKKKFHLCTKIKPDNKWTSLDYCRNKIENHINKLNQGKIETILFHDTKILYRKNGKQIFNNLEILKKKRYFKKIGISIYDFDCLNYIIPNFKINVVQCPYNILDRRILKSKWFNKLKIRGIEIHVRSIFLQGLLVNKTIHKKKQFKKWKLKISEWFKSLERNNISPVNYCLNDLIRHDFDKIVIGISKLEDFKEILDFRSKKNINKVIDLNIKDSKLIDPRKW
tara:strand:- start:255 stop:1115 length:861 start_codon:yes stop_codon:yes gene_type:complete